MRVRLASGKNRGRWVSVPTWQHASNVVRGFIDDFGLTAGCGSSGTAFTGGEVVNDTNEPIGRISYNGRAWDLNDQPIDMSAR